MLVAVAVLAGVVILCVGVALLDRICAALAERRASEYLSVPFGHPATVRVLGTPFLTQAMRGRYSEVEVSGGGLRVGEINGATLVATLTNVHLPTRELLGGRTTELPCEHVAGRMILPYGELARVAKIPGLSLYFGGGKLLAEAAAPIPGFSQLASVRGEALLTQAGTGTVWLRINGLSVVGIAVPGIVLNQLLPRFNVPIPLPSLPYGLRIDELRPTESGLLVVGSAEAVVFRKPVYA